MTEDRRKTRKLTQDDVRKILNHKQLSALLESQYFGWKLKFIRTPLFQSPIPVLYNTRTDQVGILDPDGHIKIDVNLQERASPRSTG